MIDSFSIELANVLPDGLVICDHDLKIMWSNQVAKQLLNKHNDIENRSLNDYFPKHNKKAFTGDHVDLIVTLEFSHLVDHYFSVIKHCYKPGLDLFVIKDITHTHKLEAMRQDFIANVSHELRTPLTVFHGYLTLLQENSDVPQDKLKEILAQMAGQTTRMERLVEDLLLLSQLECHEPDHQRHTQVVIPSMLKDIVKDAALLSAGQHQFKLNIDNQLFYFGQAEELRSAFSNLIFNAVRYTPDPGIIDVRWYKDKDQCIFEVIDNGIGIPEKHVDRITQRFYQVDKSRTYRGIGGTGLGLAIVKHVLIRHNGELLIQSHLGKGSQFRCQLPESKV